MILYPEKIIETIGRYQPISLEEMDNVRLMNRTDTKFVFPSHILPFLLEQASDKYRVLSINEQRIFRYNSLYFDTPGIKAYFDHHNGRRPRFKVRIREYEDTGSFFLEVKRKLGNERTRKSRIRLDGIDSGLSIESKEYIARKSPFDPDELLPALWTIFRRITLVGTGAPERITIDTELEFRHENKSIILPYFSIAEVKRNKAGGATDFSRILRQSRIYPGSNSKYCLGTILLKDPIKHNRFKPNMLKLKKIENVYRSFLPTG